MLDAFKRRGVGDGGKSAKEQVAELQELIGQAREERAALSTMLTQVEVHGSKLSTLGRSMQDVNDRAGGATGKMAALVKRLSKLEARATGLEKIGNRVETLRGGVRKVEETAQQLLAPNGELQKHRHEVQQLSAQATQNVALLDAMKKEQSTLDEFRERLRVAQTDVEDSASKATSMKADFDRLRGLTGKLTKDHARLKDSLRETREQATATTEAVRDVEKKLGPVAEMHELSKSTETRMATLNSLAEHVLQKVKVLEKQKHTVEHAVVEANRLNEMVWNMDVQVAKLKDGAQQTTQVEEIVNRIEVLTNATVARLDQATQTKESFTRELNKLEQGKDELTDFVRGCFERLTVKQKELDAFDERLKSLHTGLSNSEKSINSLQEPEKDLGALGQRTEGIEKRVAGLMDQAEDLQKKQAELETLRDRLAQVDELTKRTSYQFGAIEKSREDLEGLRKEIQEFYTAHTALSKTIATLAADKKAFEGFLQRTDEFRREIPDLDSKIDSITSKLSMVEEGDPEGGNPRRGRRGSRPSDDADCRASATGRKGRGAAQYPEYAERGRRQPDAGATGAPRRSRITQESLRRVGDTGDGRAAAGRRRQRDSAEAVAADDPGCRAQASGGQDRGRVPRSQAGGGGHHRAGEAAGRARGPEPRGRRGR